jgi:dTDP-4-amino-4,6-dideoxygalactose transaminase
MFRTLPPTAAPIRFRDLLRAIGSSLNSSNREERFRDQIKEYFGVEHVFLVSSGKTAIYLTLQALQKISKRREVIIPAYSSFCLASAVARSGLSVRLCDIDPETLDFDLNRLKTIINENTLAVIPVHNYGLVCKMSEIRNLAQEKGAWVIEDAAQAAGATYKGQKVGTVGDVGILSLGRGKNICALEGGVILTNEQQIAELISEEFQNEPHSSLYTDSAGLVNGLALSLFLNPNSYVIPASLPFLRLGANIFDPTFKIARLPSLNAEIGRISFPNLEEYNKIRIRNAQSFQNSINDSHGLSLPKPNSSGQSVYLRFPIIFQGNEVRDQALKSLNGKRLGVSPSYPKPLHEIDAFRKYLVDENDFPEARLVSERTLTLPTHPYVKEHDIDLIVSTINTLLRDSETTISIEYSSTDQVSNLSN